MILQESRASFAAFSLGYRIFRHVTVTTAPSPAVRLPLRSVILCGGHGRGRSRVAHPVLVRVLSACRVACLLATVSTDVTPVIYSDTIRRVPAGVVAPDSL